jgi:hypothetical protein
MFFHEPSPNPRSTRWVYDDPSGLPEPDAYPRPWRRRPKRAAQVTVLRSRVRVTHVEN